MLNINMLDNKIGKYIESKKLKAEDVESVELGITTSDLQFVDVSRSEGLSDRIELLNESKRLSTKEGFNQYATEMKELNRSMIKSCDEYAGLADYLGIEDEKEIKKLSKEQILKGTTYIQFLEDVKNKITFNFAKHMYFCCLLEDNAMQKECMFALKKIGKDLDYEQIYKDQIWFLTEIDSRKSSTNWINWFPEKRTLISYVIHGLMRTHAVDMSKHINYKNDFSYDVGKGKDDEESNLDLLNKLSFIQSEHIDSDSERHDKNVKLLKEIRGICTEEEWKVIVADVAYKEYAKGLKYKKKVNKLNRTDYINKKLGTNYTSRKIENYIGTARDKMDTRMRHVERLEFNKLLLKAINSELKRNYTLEELNDKLIWIKKEIKRKKHTNKSDSEILLDAINHVFNTTHSFADNKSYMLVSFVQEAINYTIPKNMDSEFMELLAYYKKSQEKVDKYNKFADEIAQKNTKEKLDRLKDYLGRNKTFKYLFNYLCEHEKQSVSNFIQSYTYEAAWSNGDNMMWEFIGKHMVEKYLDEIKNYSKFVPEYDIEDFIYQMSLGYLRGKGLLTNDDEMMIHNNRWKQQGSELNFNFVKECMFKFEPEKAKELYEIIDRKLEMGINREVKTDYHDYYGYECITL